VIGPGKKEIERAWRFWRRAYARTFKGEAGKGRQRKRTGSIERVLLTGEIGRDFADSQKISDLVSRPELFKEKGCHRPRRERRGSREWDPSRNSGKEAVGKKKEGRAETSITFMNGRKGGVGGRGKIQGLGELGKGTRVGGGKPQRKEKR